MKRAEPQTAVKVKMFKLRSRAGFECSVCRVREVFDDAKGAIAGRKVHVATAVHRSGLRAARRE